MPNNDVRILLGMPCPNTIYTLTSRSLLEWQMHRRYPAQIRFKIDTVLEKARNELVSHAVEARATHLMFVDSDMVFPAHAIDQLVDRQKDIIGGLYYGRMQPKPMVFRLDEKRKAHPITPKDANKKGLAEVDFVGTGFMLINMRVFEKLEPPFFRFSYEYDKLDMEGNGLNPIGEDAYFCLTAKQAGFSVWCDTTFELGHVGYHTYRKHDYDVWQEDGELYERV